MVWASGVAVGKSKARRPQVNHLLQGLLVRIAANTRHVNTFQLSLREEIRSGLVFIVASSQRGFVRVAAQEEWPFCIG
jgi:hypothetical protein